MPILLMRKKSSNLESILYPTSSAGKILELDAHETNTVFALNPSPNTFTHSGEILPGSGKPRSLVPGSSLSRYAHSDLVLASGTFAFHLIVKLPTGSSLNLNSRINHRSVHYDDGLQVFVQRTNATSVRLAMSTSNVWLFDRIFSVSQINGDWMLVKLGWDGGSFCWGNASNTNSGVEQQFTPLSALNGTNVSPSYSKTSNRMEISGSNSLLQLFRMYKGSSPR